MSGMGTLSAQGSLAGQQLPWVMLQEDFVDPAHTVGKRTSTSTGCLCKRNWDVRGDDGQI